MFQPLSKHDKAILVAALATVTPSGGGSATHALLRRLARKWDVDLSSDEHTSMVYAFANNVVREAIEADVVREPMPSYFTIHTNLDALPGQVATVLTFVTEPYVKSTLDIQYNSKDNSQWVADDMLIVHGAQVLEVM